MSISTSANTFPPKLKPSIHGQGWSARQRRCGGERSPSLSRPTSASPGPHFLGQVCITKRFPRPCSELEKVVWELEKSPDTISTSTKRHVPPTAAPLTTLHCPGGGDATRGGCAGNDEDEGSGGVRACACAACAACAFVCPCSCTCAACAACACASTRAAFLVPPNSWQPRDTTTVRVLVRVRRT